MKWINYIIAYNDNEVLFPWNFDGVEVQNAQLEDAIIDLKFVKEEDPTKDWKIYQVESQPLNF